MFRLIAQRRMRRSFRALRVANGNALRDAGMDPLTAPLVVYLNHPSWWDPLTAFVLSRHLIGERSFYAPMDAESLKRYRILSHLGMFPVAMDSPRGAAQFMRGAQAVLDAGHVLGVTPQGHFTDVRDRSAVLRPGLAALLQRRAAQGLSTAVLPLALEYTFWNQRLPEALALAGEPLWVDAAHPQTTTALQAELASRLQTAQDRLAALSTSRDTSQFSVVLDGRRGSAGFYSLWEYWQGLRGVSTKKGDHNSHFGTK